MKNKPERLRRADSFLGIHFDFHAREDCTEIGKNVTHKMVERIIKQVRPDWIHPDGWMPLRNLTGEIQPTIF